MSGAPADGTTDWREQLELMAPILLAWASVRLRGQPNADAEDLAQEVLCRAMLRIDTFHGGNFHGWVFTIGKHVLLEFLRRRHRGGRIRVSGGDTAAEAALAQVAARMTTLTRKISKREDVQNLLRVLGELDEPDRKLAVLCGMEGQTCGAAAVQLGVSEEAAAKRWQRLRARLREAAAWLGG